MVVVLVVGVTAVARGKKKNLQSHGCRDKDACKIQCTVVAVLA